MNEKKKALILALSLVLVVIMGAAAYRVLSAGAGAGFVGTASSQAEETPQSGSASAEQAETVPAPECVFYDEQGEAVALSSLLDGTPVIINFWASTCPPCRQEMPDFQAAYEEYGDRIRFIMVDGVGSMMNETQEAGMAYVSEQGFTFPVYFDNDRDAVSQFGITAFPTTYLIDGEGNVIAGARGMISAEDLETAVSMLLEE